MILNSNNIVFNSQQFFFLALKLTEKALISHIAKTRYIMYILKYNIINYDMIFNEIYNKILISLLVLLFEMAILDLEIEK